MSEWGLARRVEAPARSGRSLFRLKAEATH